MINRQSTEIMKAIGVVVWMVIFVWDSEVSKCVGVELLTNSEEDDDAVVAAVAFYNDSNGSIGDGISACIFEGIVDSIDAGIIDRNGDYIIDGTIDGIIDGNGEVSNDDNSDEDGANKVTVMAVEGCVGAGIGIDVLVV